MANKELLVFNSTSNQIEELQTGDKAIVNTDTLVIDKGEGKVGIGTASPSGTDIDGTVLEIKDSTNNVGLNINAANTAKTAMIELHADRPSDGNLAGNIQFFNNGATQIAEIRATRGSTDLKGDLVLRTSDTNRLYIDEDGKVGIGTDIPDHTLSIVGTAYADGGAGTGNTVFGKTAGDSLAADGNYNAFFGENAGTENTTGDYNVAIGADALPINTSGLGSIAIGRTALYSSTTSSYNVAIGTNSLYANTGGTRNIAMGYRSQRRTTSGSDNTAIGYDVMFANTTGSNNTALGSYVLDANIGGSDNTAVGNNVLTANTSGGSNTAIGKHALYANITGDDNVAVGKSAGAVITTESDNVFIGKDSASLMYGGDNVAVGKDALKGTASFTDATCDYNFGTATDPTITHTANASIIAGLGVSGSLVPDGAYISSISSAGFTDIVRSTAISSGTTIVMDGAQTGMVVGMVVTASTGVIPAQTQIASITSTSDPATFELDTALSAELAADTVLTFSGIFELSASTLAGSEVTNGTLTFYSRSTDSVAIGAASLSANTTGSGNTGVGKDTLLSNTTGDSNTAVGFNAGSSITTGSNNTIIGEYAGTTALADTVAIYAGTTERIKVDADGMTVNGSAVGGKVLQVLSVTKTDTFTTTSTSYVDITGLTIAITPSAASSKIIVMYNAVIQNTGNTWATLIQLMRDSTAISVGAGASNRPPATGGSFDGSISVVHPAGSFLDSPSSTSAVTYKMQMKVQGNTGVLNRSGPDSDATYTGRYASSITVMEIGA